MEQDCIIRAEDLSVVFAPRKKGAPINAVDKVSLDVRRGEVLAVVGESGSGKTTLGKALLGVIPASSGKAIYDGRDLSSYAGRERLALRSKLQLIFQDPYESLDPRQNCYETLREPLLIHRPELSKDEKNTLIYKYLEAVGLHPAKQMAERYPHHLSGGQRQRLSIASVMILEPEFVVADEPVSMLDVSVRAEILKLMLDLKELSKLTYMFITHDLSLAWSIADRIAVFYLGALMEIGTADDVIHRGMHPYTKALISVMPSGADAGSGAEDIPAPKKLILEGETPAPSGFTDCCRFASRCPLYKEKGEPEICRCAEPELKDLGGGHEAACHFAG